MAPWMTSQGAPVAASPSRTSPARVKVAPTMARARGFRRRIMNRNNISTSSGPWASKNSAASDGKEIGADRIAVQPPFAVGPDPHLQEAITGEIRLAADNAEWQSAHVCVGVDDYDHRLRVKPKGHLGACRKRF